MKTMLKLCRRFGRLHKGCDAYLDTLGSYPGFYRVCIHDHFDREESFAWYTFRSCKEFKEWSENVLI